MIFLQFIFSSFWVWLGFTMILSGIGTFLFRVINRLIRKSNISKHGWPPEYLDADGDFRKKEEQAK